MCAANPSVFLSLGLLGAAAAQPLTIPTSCEPLRVPIHSAAADVGGDYGVWAAGPDYKASFHDGFVFYPVLGKDAPRNLPWRWTTTSVCVGSRELAGCAVTPVRAGDWRYEYRGERYTEAYDVGVDGVEQTFILHGPVGTPGDLIVCGQVATSLRVAAVAVAGDGVCFCDPEGRPVVRYGAARAIDASGASRAMTTTWDGECLTLRLDGAWLANAAYPVTVDPLVGSALVSLGTATVDEPSIATGIGINEMAVCFVRHNSAADADLFVRLASIDWTAPATVFADVSATWTTPHCDVAYARGAHRWVVAMERGFPSAQSTLIRDHVHDVGDQSLSTTYGIVTSNPSEQCTLPSIGGANTADSEVLIAYQIDRGAFGEDTPSSEVWATIRDAATGTQRPQFELGHRTAGFDAEWPDVAPLRNVDGPWYVVFQEIDSMAGARYRARIVRVTPSALLRGPFVLSDQSYVHWVRPRIAGYGNEFMLTAACGGLQTTNYPRVSGFYVRSVRFQWPETVTVPAVSPSTTVRGVYSGPEVIHNLALAFDHDTASHWAVITRDSQSDTVQATRLGYWSGVAESTMLPAGCRAAAAEYSGGRRGFVIAHDVGTSLLGTLFAYPTRRDPVYFAPGCGNGQAVIWNSHSSAPHSGSNNFQIELSRVPPGASAILFLSTARANLALDGLGMPGCILAVDLGAPNLIVPFDLIGTIAEVRLPLRAPIAGIFVAQFAYTDPGANALGLRMTNVVEFEVR